MGRGTRVQMSKRWRCPDFSGKLNSPLVQDWWTFLLCLSFHASLSVSLGFCLYLSEKPLFSPFSLFATLHRDIRNTYFQNILPSLPSLSTQIHTENLPSEALICVFLFLSLSFLISLGLYPKKTTFKTIFSLSFYSHKYRMLTSRTFSFLFLSLSLCLSFFFFQKTSH